MTEHLVRVTFRKQVSDGNFGTEAAEVTLEDVVDDEADGDAMATLLGIQARRVVHAELARSPSAIVRRTVQPQPPQPTRPYRGPDAPFIQTRDPLPAVTGGSLSGSPTDYPDEDPVN
jgi:hypothetical protein